MLLTEDEHNLITTMKYLVGKQLKPNQTKVNKFCQLSLKMKDENLKKVQKDINEKEKISKDMEKSSFLKSLLGIHELSLVNRTPGLTIHVNKYILLLMIILLTIIVSPCRRTILLSTIIVVQVAMLVYQLYNYRSLILMKYGIVNQNDIIRLYKNERIFSRLGIINVIPNYRKLYVKTMSDQKMVKILEDKLVNKDEIQEWTDYMQLPSKLARCYDIIITLIKIIIIIAIIYYGAKVRAKITGIRQGLVKIRNLHVLDQIKEVKEKIQELGKIKEEAEKINDQIINNINRLNNIINNAVNITGHRVEEFKDSVKEKVEKLRVAINDGTMSAGIRGKIQLVNKLFNRYTNDKDIRSEKEEDIKVPSSDEVSAPIYK
jgi:hypothetical protein